MKKNLRNSIRPALIFLTLMSIVIISRSLPHPPHLTAVTALALMSGLIFPRLSMAISLPVLALGLSDALIFGFYPGALVNYAALILAALTTFFFAQKSAGKKVIGAALGSFVFFVFSNLGVFISSGMYPRTFEGLASCYVMAVPFYGYQILGELLYGAVLASTYFILNGRSWLWNSAPVRSSL